jgi:hypothetical protein
MNKTTTIIAGILLFLVSILLYLQATSDLPSTKLKTTMQKHNDNRFGTSIDSIKSMSCEELHENYYNCVKQSYGTLNERLSGAETLHCDNLYLHVYYTKCVKTGECQ